MSLVDRNLSTATDPSLGAFTANQNKAILIVGLVCSSISLAVTLVTLRWFILMKRLFRHRLVLFLILSDTFKALWYFIFPIVVFAHGSVKSSSAWCQISGFFLSFAIEASDFSILLIALHAMLYIFRPPVRIGKGGLYKYRKWIPIVWLGPPAISASVAFANHGRGYITAGTFCYLPKRPIWYRLALAYIPRYIILLTIFFMYAAISIYVHVKFRTFKAVVTADSESDFDVESERSSFHTDSIAPDEIVLPERAVSPPPPEPEKRVVNPRPTFHRGFSHRAFQTPATSAPEPEYREPWDAMNFITSKPLQDTGISRLGVQANDFATQARGSASSEETRVDSRDPAVQFTGFSFEPEKPRMPSEAPTVNTTGTGNTNETARLEEEARRRKRQMSVRDPLSRTRAAIRQQLRFLFVYPAAYALMWAFPFAQNCTLYSDYYATHPIFWLQIVATCALSLQAAVDCLVFSWREKPWQRVDANSRMALPFWRDQSVSLIKRLSLNGSALFGSHNSSRKNTATAEEEHPPNPEPIPRRKSRNWWEEEGKKRKDSVWMGTDLLARFTTRQSDHERNGRIDTIEEHEP